MCSHIDSMRAISVCFFLLSFILYGNYVAIIDQLMKREWTNTLRTMNRRKQTRSHTSDRPRANKLEAACMRHFLYHTAKNSTHFEEIVILFLLGIIGMQCIDVIVSKWNEEKKSRVYYHGETDCQLNWSASRLFFVVSIHSKYRNEWHIDRVHIDCERNALG